VGLVKLYGIGTTFSKMKELLKKIFFGETTYDYLIEGVAAHHYKDEAVRQQIKEQYIKTHTPEITPFTDPLKFDPFNPPEGWSYDPYYECWIKYK
jgi:hypothetical protein